MLPQYLAGVHIEPHHIECTVLRLAMLPCQGDMALHTTFLCHSSGTQYQCVTVVSGEGSVKSRFTILIAESVFCAHAFQCHTIQ